MEQVEKLGSHFTRVSVKHGHILAAWCLWCGWADVWCFGHACETRVACARGCVADVDVCGNVGYLHGIRNGWADSNDVTGTGCTGAVSDSTLDGLNVADFQSAPDSSSSPGPAGAYACTGTGNVIKWNVGGGSAADVVLGDFDIVSVFNASKLEATGLKFMLWKSDGSTAFYVGLDAAGMKYSYDIGSGEHVTSTDSLLNIHEYQTLRLIRRDNVLMLTLDGVTPASMGGLELSAQIAYVGWSPGTNSIFVKQLYVAPLMQGDRS